MPGGGLARGRWRRGSASSSSPSSSLLTGSLRQAIAQRFPKARFHGLERHAARTRCATAPPWRSASPSSRTTSWRRPTSSSPWTRTSSRLGHDTVDQNAGLRRSAASRTTARGSTGSTWSSRGSASPAAWRTTGSSSAARTIGRSPLALAAELGKALRRPLRSGAPVRPATSAAKFVAAVAEDLAGKRGAALVIARRAADRARPCRSRTRSTRRWAPWAAPSPSPPRGAGRRHGPLELAAAGGRAPGRQGRHPGHHRLEPGVTPPPATSTCPTLLAKVPERAVYLGLHEDETVAAVDWFLPAAHPLESWGDARSREGTLSIVQPLIQPLFNGVSEAELLAAFLDATAARPYELAEDPGHASAREGRLRRRRGRVWLSTGVVPGTASPAVTPSPQRTGCAAAAGQARPPAGRPRARLGPRLQDPRRPLR